MPTGIGGSFQLANSAPPLGVIGSASAPTARMRKDGTNAGLDMRVNTKGNGRAQNDYTASYPFSFSLAYFVRTEALQKLR